MSTDILRTRLEELRRNADEVESVLKALEQSRETVKSAQRKMELVARTPVALTTLGDIEDVKERLQRTDPVAHVQLAAAEKAVRERDERIKALNETLDATLKAMSLLIKRHVRLGEAWRQPVTDTTKALRDKIRDLDKKASDGGTAPGALWVDYAESIYPLADQLFSEYLDLLGGVAIRELGLRIGALAEDEREEEEHQEEDSAMDEVRRLDELCEIADWHAAHELRQCVGWAETEPALTLPGRDARGEVSWPIVRFGFAYWSIWGMPLEAHEFGRVVAARNQPGLDDLRNELGAFGRRGLRTLTADVIGAWAGGPAYACALLFLALAPSDLIDDAAGAHVTAADRALVVDACLRYQIVAHDEGVTPENVDERARAADAQYGYLEFVDGIASRWDETVGTSEDAKGDRPALLRALPGKVKEVLGLERPFRLRDWRKTKEVWQALEKDEPPSDDRILTGIRHLMNAAWYARLSPNVALGSEPKLIETRTLRAGKRIVHPIPGPSRRGDKVGGRG